MAILPKVKLKALPVFPANVETSSFITAEKSAGQYTLGVDYTLISGGFVTDPATSVVIVLDQADGAYKLVSLSQVSAVATQIEQHVIAPGPISVLQNSGIVRVDQTVGAAMTLNLPLAATKTCPVLVADWKNDAGTNNITLQPSGSEKIQGLASWVIASDGGSIFLRPIPGVGYVI